MRLLAHKLNKEEVNAERLSPAALAFVGRRGIFISGAHYACCVRGFAGEHSAQQGGTACVGLCSGCCRGKNTAAA